MADTQRTRAAILVLFADNVTGQISAQRLRDAIVTIMEPEFANPGDFWKMPNAKQTLTDRTARGWIDYSQMIDSNASTDWGECMYLAGSGVWKKACASQSARNAVCGLVLGSYASGTSTAQIFRKGIIYDSTLSARWTGNNGRPVYLCSDVDGSYSITLPVGASILYYKILGIVEVSDDHGTLASGKWRFDPEWAVKGT